MNYSKFNMIKIFLSFILTLGCLLAGWFIYYEFGIIKSMQNDILEIPSVRVAEIITEQDILTVAVELGEVDSLKHSYQEIKKLLPHRKPCTLEINDQRNDYLKELCNKNRFAMEEAATIGNFTEMQQLITENLSKENIDRWHLEIDGENIYLQIHDNGDYLYEIIPRHDFPVVSGKV